MRLLEGDERNAGAPKTSIGSAAQLGSVLLLAALLGTPASAAWQRCVYTAKGEWVDRAEVHSLSWFTRDAFLRDDGNEFCIACTDQEKATLHLKRKARSEVHLIGTMRGSNIYDLFYFFDSEDRVRWKSILVKTKAGQYREIYHLQPTNAEIEPSFLVKAGDVELLGTSDSIPGSGANRYQAYFQFTKDWGEADRFQPHRSGRRFNSAARRHDPQRQRTGRTVASLPVARVETG